MVLVGLHLGTIPTASIAITTITIATLPPLPPLPPQLSTAIVSYISMTGYFKESYINCYLAVKVVAAFSVCVQLFNNICSFPLSQTAPATDPCRNTKRSDQPDRGAQAALANQTPAC